MSLSVMVKTGIGYGHMIHTAGFGSGIPRIIPFMQIPAIGHIVEGGISNCQVMKGRGGRNIKSSLRFPGGVPVISDHGNIIQADIANIGAC